MKTASLAAWLRTAAQKLPEPETAHLEAQLLAARAMGVSRAWLVAHGDEPLSTQSLEILEPLFARRGQGEPIAHIFSEREFYGRPFRVSPDCLIPRPETEHLIEAVLARISGPANVLDIGTGSGCIAITLALENPSLRLTAIDLSPAALAIARHNADALTARIEWHCGNLYTPVAGQQFDAIVSNPPYIAESDPHLTRGDLRFEPRLALTSGIDGLNTLRPLITQATQHLTPGGWLFVEHGYDQGPACVALFAQAGFQEVCTVVDLAGQPRLTQGRILVAKQTPTVRQIKKPLNNLIQRP